MTDALLGAPPPFAYGATPFHSHLFTPIPAHLPPSSQIRAIAEGLKTNKKLNGLFLSHCGLGNGGASEVGGMLKVKKE